MRVSVEGKLAALLVVVLTATAAAAAWLSQRLGLPLAMVVTIACGVLPILWIARRTAAPVRRLLRAMMGAVSSYRDGDFGLSLVVDRRDEIGALALAHNELGEALREQRQQLAQRELLLDAVTQRSPVAILLVDSHGKVVYANIAARHMVNEGKSLLGQDFALLLTRLPAALQEAMATGEDCLFSVEIDRDEERYHLSQRGLQLRGRSHRLYQLKRLTRELSRQEVAIWKKLIRVLSHELNNSLAPISSLAQSGAELARRGELVALSAVLKTIDERASHLHRFIESYAEIARLPTPNRETVDWEQLINTLQRHVAFTLIEPLPGEPGYFDRVQIEQLLINLLKNALESGSDPLSIELSVTDVAGAQRIEVRDRGTGMTETVLNQALLPFYSTKHSGTGLGLALSREITEAHGGQIRLENRPGGGLIVSIVLPAAAMRGQ